MSIGFNMRPLHAFERSLIQKVADLIPGPAGAVLRYDVDNASAVDCSSDYSKVLFIIDGYEIPPYHGQCHFPVEIRALDSDGGELTVIIYSDSNGRLFELEVIRWDGKAVIDPRWDTLDFY
ncbi:DUF6984 family protein [Xanthomonas hortorum]|uniref:DUF6984 family protein n=1 Tax=Xanthomonas hortorum TaxID=56454 RepID=UPI0012601652|nr:hypothetical protein [Xanthomonas hortorum]